MAGLGGRGMEDEAMDEERQDQRMLDENDISPLQSTGPQKFLIMLLLLRPCC